MQFAFDRGNPLRDCIAVPDQNAILSQTGAGPMRFRNHVQEQEFGQDLGIDLVRFVFALGDDPQLFRMGQDAPFSQVFNQRQEPLVIARGLDDHSKDAQRLEELADGRCIGALEGPPPLDPPLLAFFYHNAHRDTLLVEIDAHILHDSFLMWRPLG